MIGLLRGIEDGDLLAVSISNKISSVRRNVELKSGGEEQVSGGLSCVISNFSYQAKLRVPSLAY